MARCLLNLGCISLKEVTRSCTLGGEGSESDWLSEAPDSTILAARDNTSRGDSGCRLPTSPPLITITI